MIPSSLENIWEHSQNVRELYAKRAAGENEMDAARQCADILKPLAESGEKFLDAGCGSGYLFHSLKKAGLNLDYHGLDYSPSLIALGQEILTGFGLPKEKLQVGRLEDLAAQPFDLIALLNTLTFCPDFRAPLDRLAQTGARIILIRDNFGEETIIRWEEDGFLDPGFNHLKAYWNQWQTSAVKTFLADYGFKVSELCDLRTQGAEELVVGKPYYWSWLLAVR